MRGMRFISYTLNKLLCLLIRIASAAQCETMQRSVEKPGGTSSKRVGRMNIAQLKTFVNLAKTLNYSETARSLFISQPAVTQQIARLEAELGVRLFERSRRGVALTSAGKSYYEDCVDAVARLEAARERAKNQAEHETETLRMGCAIWAFILRLDKLVARLRRSMPNMRVGIVPDETESLIGDLAREELDVVFAAQTSRVPSSGVAFEKLFDGRLVCVVPASSPFADAESVRLCDLDGQTLLLLEDGRCPAEMRDVQSTVSLAAPHSPVIYNASEFIGATLAAGGVGIAPMPDFVCPAVDGVARVPVADYGSIPFGIYHGRRDASAKTRAVIDAAERLYGANARLD